MLAIRERISPFSSDFLVGQAEQVKVRESEKDLISRQKSQEVPTSISLTLAFTYSLAFHLIALSSLASAQRKMP